MNYQVSLGVLRRGHDNDGKIIALERRMAQPFGSSLTKEWSFGHRSERGHMTPGVWQVHMVAQTFKYENPESILQDQWFVIDPIQYEPAWQRREREEDEIVAIANEGLEEDAAEFVIDERQSYIFDPAGIIPKSPRLRIPPPPDRTVK